MFGKDFLKKSTLPQQAKVLDHVRDDLTQNARLMGTAARGKSALETAGETTIDQPELQARADTARRLGDLLPRFAYQAGTETNATLKRLGYELAEQPRQKNAIFERARTEIPDAIRRDAQGAGLDITVKPQEPTPQQSMFGGQPGVTELGGGLAPVPAVRSAQAFARNLVEKFGQSGAVDKLKNWLAPETRGAFAQRAASIQEEQAAELRARVGSAKHLAAGLRDYFSKLVPEQRYQVYSQLESGNFDALPAEQRPIAQAFRAAYQKSWENVARVRGDDGVGYIDNYMGEHLYANTPEEIRDRFNALQQGTGKALTGSSKFLKQRKWRLMVDALAPQTLDNGVVVPGLKPRFDNPADMMVAGLQNQWRYITGQDLFQNLKDAGLAKFYPFGQEPKDWAPIDDKIAMVKQYAPEYKGYIERGHYLAPEQAARVINNYLAPGLQGGFQRGLRSVSALGNALRVELSGFHAMLEANSLADIEAGGALSDGFGKLTHGDIKGGLTSLAKVPKTWLTVPDAYKTWAEGKKLLTKAAQGQLEDPALREVIMGGGSFDFGDSILGQAMSDGIVEKLGVPGKVAQKVLGATMREIVTPMKLGAFQKLYAKELGDAMERSGGDDLTYVQRRQIAQGVRRHLDNVMGQIARDNLHTTNTFKDILANIVSYPGWNIGTIRLFGGIGRGAFQLATGQAIDQDARLALQYAAGKAIRAGLQGALMNKFVTGQWPKNVYEMYTWPTGQKDSNGNYIRVSPPEYLIRDLLSFIGHEKKQDPSDVFSPFYALTETAAGKLNWPLVAGYEIYKNADFFGHPIRFPKVESKPKQVADILGYIAKQGGVPFSVRNVQEQAEQTGTGALTQAKQALMGPDRAAAAGALGKQALVGAVGLTPAPKSLRQTPMQNYLDSVEDAQFRAMAADPRQLDRLNALRNFETQARAVRRGDIKQIPAAITRQALTAGATQQELADRWKASRLTPEQAALHRVPLIEVARAWKIARNNRNTEDAEQARKAMFERIGKGGWQRLRPEDRTALVPLLGEMLHPTKGKVTELPAGGA